MSSGNNPASAPDEGGEHAVFRRYPYEIKTMIFTEALSKPHVHFMLASLVELEERREDGRRLWSTKFNALPTKKDASGFRLTNEISEVSELAAKAMEVATIEKVRMPFTRQTRVVGTLDASTDVVCVEFGKLRDWRNVRFAREHQFLPQVFQRDKTIAQLRGIHRVGITYDGRPSVFRCLHGRHLSCQLCPDELLGWLDCFPDLESVYIIVRYHHTLARARKNLINAYRHRFFSLSHAERNSKGLEVFHSCISSFIEVHSDFVDIDGMPFNWAVPNLLAELQRAFNRPPNPTPAQYTMSPEKRQNLKFKFLVEIDRK